ncbi:DUF4288 domain-containing protein [Streptosporangium canum]|uniref:DUF4288 domain-containing protein n=1 Tax=Streptosporangium canum TaxID=324952 RepID=UPI00339DC8D0
MPERLTSDDTARRPYIAILVYRTAVEGGHVRARYSEDITLIHERSIEEARTRAEMIGRDGETSYSNEYGETVSWEFVGIADVRGALYDDLDSDTGLYTRSFDDLSQYKNVFSLSSLDGQEA